MVRLLLASAAIAFGGSLAQTAEAENLIYSPLNPGLGGNPDLYGYLIGLADIQNQYAEESGSDGFPVFDFPDIDIDLGGGFDDDEPDAPDDTQQ